MNRAHITLAVVWLASVAVWWGVLAQLSTPRHASIPDRSTLTQYPGP